MTKRLSRWFCVAMAAAGFGFSTEAQMMGPMPDIKVNGSDGPVMLSPAQMATVSVSLYPEMNYGTQADWWCVVHTPYPAPLNWVHVGLGGRVTPGIAPSYQGALFALNSTPLLTRTLPAGVYTFYFGVDTRRNGILELGPGEFFYDSVTVTVAPSGGEGQYLVIDLSAGPTATSYPVSYLDSVPNGGWTDEYKTTRLVLRRIDAGTFTMGSPEEELGHYPNEVQHEVRFTHAFYIGVFEVTQRQWERVMGSWPSWFVNPACRETRPVESVSYNEIRESADNADELMVYWPSNDDVGTTSFMGRLRAKTGLATLDLPTESQWEYACRAGTTTALNNSTDITDPEVSPSLNAVGRYWYNGGRDSTRDVDVTMGTASAGAYQPNGWGLYDMHGNVYEWCLDFPGPYPQSAADPQGAESGSGRTIRGGSWGHGAGGCRSAFRWSNSPTAKESVNGFRIVRNVP